jgi:hypothetical protein
VNEPASDATADPSAAPAGLVHLDETPGHECGLFGVFAPDQPVAHLAYLGLYAIQHRGQESAGMAVSDGQTITVVKDMGLVSAVFDDAPSPHCPVTLPSVTRGTRPRGRARGATPSPSTATSATTASPWPTTAIS